MWPMGRKVSEIYDDYDHYCWTLYHDMLLQSDWTMDTIIETSLHVLHCYAQNAIDFTSHHKHCDFSRNPNNYNKKTLSAKEASTTFRGVTNM